MNHEKITAFTIIAFLIAVTSVTVAASANVYKTYQEVKAGQRAEERQIEANKAAQGTLQQIADNAAKSNADIEALIALLKEKGVK